MNQFYLREGVKKIVKEFDCNKRFQTIQDAGRTTGLSQYFLRRGCRDGTIPHIKSGKKFLINVPLLIEQMNQISMKQ
jgi:hypothetical protein